MKFFIANALQIVKLPIAQAQHRCFLIRSIRVIFGLGCLIDYWVLIVENAIVVY